LQGNQIVLQDLVRDKNYEIAVIPFNSQGSGPPSSPQTVYVGEAVPTGEPRELRAVALSSTEVRLSWQPPLASQQNGKLAQGLNFWYKCMTRPGHKETC
jgi:protein sidekick